MTSNRGSQGVTNQGSRLVPNCSELILLQLYTPNEDIHEEYL